MQGPEPSPSISKSSITYGSEIVPFPVQFPAALKAVQPELPSICIFPDTAESFKFS